MDARSKRYQKAKELYIERQDALTRCILDMDDLRTQREEKVALLRPPHEKRIHDAEKPVERALEELQKTEQKLVRAIALVHERIPIPPPTLTGEAARKEKIREQTLAILEVQAEFDPQVRSATDVLERAKSEYIAVVQATKDEVQSLRDSYEPRIARVKSAVDQAGQSAAQVKIQMRSILDEKE